jgi:hypothetical protein
MTLSVKNLDAPLGAEISGIELLTPIASNDVEQIEGCGASRW